MSGLRIQQFANIGAENLELYWIAGLQEEKKSWFILVIMRGVESNKYHPVLLPVGLSPLLSLGHVFVHGERSSMPARGLFGTVTIEDLSVYEEINSADIPRELYSFGKNKGGIQRLLRYKTVQGDVFIPTFELIRYLFLHNRTLANAIIRPGELNLLFHPEIPGYQRVLTLRFTSKMPKNCLSRQFAKEFSWLALDVDARRAWDSVWLQSHDQKYVAFTPPALKNSVWKFRGVQHRDQWLVLEILHLTGKKLPCDELYYGHPSMKEMVRDQGDNGGNFDSDSENNSLSRENVVYDYELDDGQNGAAAGGHKATNLYDKQSDFDKTIKVEKLLIKLNGAGGKHTKEILPSSGATTERRQVIKVSAGEPRLGAKLPPLEFNLLTPAAWDCVGDLEALTDTVRHMADRLPQVSFAMSLCQLKGGRVFSLANRKPRVGLVVIISPPDNPPIVLLDVERTGDVALSLIALHFQNHAPVSTIETSVKRILDGLVDSSGHWSHEVEQELSNVCECERLPKVLTPRSKAEVNGQTALWAMKLLSKLGLERRSSECK